MIFLHPLARDTPVFPIKHAVTLCPAKRPRVTNTRAECSSELCVSLHPSQPSVRKIGATCHPPRIRLPVAARDPDSSHRLQVFNAFIICDLMTPSLTHHLQRNLLRIQRPFCARFALFIDFSSSSSSSSTSSLPFYISYCAISFYSRYTRIRLFTIRSFTIEHVFPSLSEFN